MQMIEPSITHTTVRDRPHYLIPLAAATCVVIVLGFMVVGYPVRWNLPSILVTVLYIIVVTTVACLIPRFRQNMLAGFAVTVAISPGSDPYVLHRYRGIALLVFMLGPFGLAYALRAPSKA